MRVLKVRVTDRALSGCRLDKYLADGLRLFSRSQARERVVRVLVNGRESKLSRRVKQGDELEISYTAPPPVDVKPERLDLDVLYEDDQVIVLNKSQGMVVHPGSGNYTGTLVSGLLYRLRYRSVPALPGGPLRPGIVHRLDKDTSGVLIAAKTPAAHAFLAEQFKARRVKKTYLAIVKGSLREKQGKVVTGITRDIRDRKRFQWTLEGGKRAVTRYKTLRAYPGYSVIAFRPVTGRTHQIRIHALYLGCPVLGDPIYGRTDRRFRDATLMLHAWRLSLTLPGASEDGGESSTFRAPIPSRFKKILSDLDPRRP
jgi:23S rRNA pseudouridine1911/1915/1917 synthase